MSAGKGDQLARGAHSAKFESANVSQDKWNDIWGGNGETEIERQRRLKITGTEEEAAQAEAAVKAETQAQAEEKKSKNVVPAQVSFRAIHDKIVVVRTEIEDEKINGLFVPDESKERPQEGVVVAAGPGRWVGERFVPVSVYEGETVLFGKYSGTEVKVNDKVFLILREEEVLLVLSPAKTLDVKAAVDAIIKTAGWNNGQPVIVSANDGEVQQPRSDAGEEQNQF